MDFETIKSYILEPSCKGCHPGYKDYKTVKDSIERIADSIQANRMPKNALSLNSNLKRLLEEWIELGLPAQKPSPSEIALAPTWESLSKNIFFPKCVQCHNPGGEASFLNLSRYEQFVINKDYLLNDLIDGEFSYLIEVITDPEEPMPPTWSNIPRLTQVEVKAIIEWINKKIPRK